MRLILISIHTVSGVIALGLGSWAALRPPRERRGVIELYKWLIAVLVASLAGAVAVDWPRLPSSTRVTFAGLTVLAVYMLWRAIQASHTLSEESPGWYTRYLDHLGFSLIALFDGFAIVSAIDLHAPVWLVIAIAVAVIVAGRSVFHALARRPAIS
jgi:hypothetical protein